MHSLITLTRATLTSSNLLALAAKTQTSLVFARLLAALTLSNLLPLGIVKMKFSSALAYSQLCLFALCSVLCSLYSVVCSLHTCQPEEKSKHKQSVQEISPAHSVYK